MVVVAHHAMADATEPTGTFPTGAAIFLGLGIGGFFDGILIHQLLQWHHMGTSAGYPVRGLEDASQLLHNLKINTVFDGLFHVAAYIFVLIGLVWLWRVSRRSHIRWSTTFFVGGLLVGFGLFNLAEGIVDHHLLQIHHVNETVPREQWIYWDIGFLIWGAVMVVGGWLLWRSGKRDNVELRGAKTRQRVS